MNLYAVPAPGDFLMQGDILDQCPILTQLPSADDPDGSIRDRSYSLRVIVLTQACDLAQTKTDRVVVALVQTAAEYVRQGLLKPAQIRDQVRTGRMFGLYFLPEAPAPIALPESIVDLRDLHTLPRSVLEHLVAAGNRARRLATPYREHLAQHFAVTSMRIALPEPYETRP